jgi:DNA-binding FrmR family transcriptional regulator
MKSPQQRINNIIGQLEGIKRLIEAKDKDCFAVINQLKAAKSAVSSLMEKIIAEELVSCAVPGKENNKINKIIKEMIK